MDPGERFTYSKPMGMKNEPKIKEGILISGLPFPPFLSASYFQTISIYINDVLQH
jgi:hypothetical protein